MVRWVGFAALLVAVFAWGLAAGAYKIFPFAQVEAVHEALTQDPDARPHHANPAATERGLEKWDWETRGDIVMLGDSVTEFAPWKDMFPEANIINRGAAGDTVGGVKQRLNSILRAKPTKAFVFAGINDLNLMNPVDRILADYADVIKRLKQDEIDIYIQTIPACGDALDICTDDRRKAEIALNEGIVALAQREDVTLIDLAVAFPAGTEYRADGVHPTTKGYKVWRDVLRPYVMANLEEDKGQ